MAVRNTVLFWFALQLTAATLVQRPPPQSLTPAPAGPFHIERNRIIDSKERTFLMRGTQVPVFPASATSTQEFGPHSATTFSTIRQRWNMNAVRLPLSAAALDHLPELAKIVRSANQLELLVILAGQQLDARSWSRLGATFRDSPNVFFDIGDELNLIPVIRATGASQPVVATGGDDTNIIHEVSPRYSAPLDEQFGSLAERVPIIANDWDLHLDKKSPACDSIPVDPTEAEAIVQANLDYFDAHNISWTVSVFEPGKLITNYRDQNATTLENGWTCGEPAELPAGIGAMVQFHQWAGETRGLYAVNGAGGFMVPRGSVAIAYGPILASRDSQSGASLPPKALGKISVQLTDRADATRTARLLYASEGWGQVNFVVPDGLTQGPATITILRADGTSVSANTTIADVVPGLWTALANGRGPAVGFVNNTDPIWACTNGECRTVPIQLSRKQTTTIRLRGTGFRYAGPDAAIHVEIGGIAITMASLAATSAPGVDELTLQLPYQLRGLGETDMVFSVNKRLANVVRINIGR